MTDRPRTDPLTGGAALIWSDFCAVAPSPELRERLQQELEQLRSSEAGLASQLSVAQMPRWPGFDDGVIIPAEEFPDGTPMATIRAAALERAPLRGTVRVVVVLADFSDRAMTATTAHFQELFFSVGVMPHGSVREYYREATHGLVDIVGEVVGPVRLPQTLEWYANGNFGIGRPSGTPRANIMAQDAAVAADPTVNFGPYDNDANGYVDAFIVVHAGSGGEATGNSGDIWSHKWTLPSVYNADGTKIFAYLTIPEDAKIGVCAHELGHLLFGFPDLYDTDGTSEGIGNWCLMAGGSWGGGGDVPVHPSAWCKVNQGWAAVTSVTTGGTLSFPDVKSSFTVRRLWKDGTGGSEYFLVENRQRTGYDASLPGDGLLVWHIDESQPGNTDENHYKVALVQADNGRDLELAHNRGDGGDPYPGGAANTSFTSSTLPNSRSYAGADSCVSLTGISSSAATMTATVAVSCGKALLKDLKDGGGKELRKERPKDLKDFTKEGKEPFKERKDVFEGDKRIKDLKDVREGWWRDRPGRPWERAGSPEQLAEWSGGLGAGYEQAAMGSSGGGPGDLVEAILELQERVAAIEQALAGAGSRTAEPFIGSELRPELSGGPTYGPDAGAVQQSMSEGDPQAKRSFDTPPPR